MEKTRVKKGEKYWIITQIGFDYCVIPVISGENKDLDDDAYNKGNYFHTKEEAEAMVRKLRAVLKGAEVIEIPSEEEIKEKASDIAFTEEPYCENDLGELEYGISNMSDSAIKMSNWLKSKTIK